MITTFQYDQETNNIKSAEEEGHFSHPLISLERTQDQVRGLIFRSNERSQ